MKAGSMEDFFVMEPGFFELIDNDQTILERSPLERAAEMDELVAFQHKVSGSVWIQKGIEIIWKNSPYQIIHHGKDDPTASHWWNRIYWSSFDSSCRRKIGLLLAYLMHPPNITSRVRCKILPK